MSLGFRQEPYADGDQVLRRIIDLDQRRSANLDAAQSDTKTSGRYARRVEETDLAEIPRPIERGPVAY
jgi:hypothetical protein